MPTRAGIAVGRVGSKFDAWPPLGTHTQRADDDIRAIGALACYDEAATRIRRIAQRLEQFALLAQLAAGDGPGAEYPAAKRVGEVVHAQRREQRDSLARVLAQLPTPYRSKDLFSGQGAHHESPLGQLSASREHLRVLGIVLVQCGQEQACLVEPVRLEGFTHADQEGIPLVGSGSLSGAGIFQLGRAASLVEQALDVRLGGELLGSMTAVLGEASGSCQGGRGEADHALGCCTGIVAKRGREKRLSIPTHLVGALPNTLRILRLHEQRVVAVEVPERDAAHLSVRLRHAGEQRAAARELRKQRVEVRTFEGSNRAVNRDRIGFVVGRTRWECRDVDVVGELGEIFEGDRSS